VRRYGRDGIRRLPLQARAERAIHVEFLKQVRVVCGVINMRPANNIGIFQSVVFGPNENLCDW
jgi:hypothetical protein